MSLCCSCMLCARCLRPSVAPECCVPGVCVPLLLQCIRPSCIIVTGCLALYLAVWLAGRWCAALRCIPQGLGVVCKSPQGILKDEFVVEFFGEVSIGEGKGRGGGFRSGARRRWGHWVRGAGRQGSDKPTVTEIAWQAGKPASVQSPVKWRSQVRAGWTAVDWCGSVKLL